jgi:hypothetical protein
MGRELERSSIAMIGERSFISGIQTPPEATNHSAISININ